MRITKAEIKQILLEEVEAMKGFYKDPKTGKMVQGSLQDALEALFQRLKDEDKAEDSKNEATEEKPTYNDFIQMARDKMMAGAAPDEYPSDKQVKLYAKRLYNQYLQGASIDDLSEATDEEYLKNKEKELELLQREKELRQGIKDLQTEEYTEADAWNTYFRAAKDRGLTDDQAAKEADKEVEKYLAMNELKEVQRKIKEGSISVEEVREVVRKVVRK